MFTHILLKSFSLVWIDKENSPKGNTTQSINVEKKKKVPEGIPIVNATKRIFSTRI